MSPVRIGLFCIFVCAGIWTSVSYGVNTAVDKAIFRESVDKATHWARYMAERVPDIEQLAETGWPSVNQRSVMNEVRNVGDIFRFKLFTADGRLSLVSDDVQTETYTGTSDVIDLEPLEVAQTGLAIVYVFDGTEKPDRPDLYAEAYVPVLAGDGSVLAVVEVYVDQTATAAYFRDSFQSFGWMFMLFGSAIFALPSLAYFLQRNLTERSRKDVEFLAHFDPLTGLTNRREFAILAGAALVNKRLRYVCYMDVDHFKKINDTHGHSIGDVYLANIADILRENTQKEDIVARFGGDEFVIGFQDISMDGAVKRLRTILKMCSDQIEINGANFAGSISIGVAEVDSDDGLEDILKNADTALYHAKAAGRDTYAIYGDEMGADLKRRYDLESKIKKAAENESFQIYFQPLVCGKDRRVTGHEALLRLIDEDGGFIPPTEFIPVAESLGLIDKIGKWTIKTAIMRVAQERDDKTIAINLSSLQFESGELVETVCAALDAADFPANQLELEITESLLLQDDASVEMQIDALRDMGVRIAMDDFGTGFSSLSYLWKYGFDRLKIDRSFVAALEENSDRSREIIESVVMLGARLNMQITAEGVETPAQSDFLSSLGCDTLQGFLFGKPAPYGEAHPSQTAENNIVLKKAG